MVEKRSKKTLNVITKWTSYWLFILAAIGSSIGLGNLWKFPYEMGSHGGGTFLIVYIPCVILVALPVMMSEIMIGRYGNSNPVHGVRSIAKKENLTRVWQVIGWLSMLCGFLVFSYYSVVAGWILFYIMQSATGSFVDVPAEIVQHSFSALLRNTDQMLIWHTVFILMVVLVLTRSVRVGLEWALRFLMPCFVGLLVWLCFYVSQFGDVEGAINFVFSYDLSIIDAELIVSAFTQALFSLSIGLGALLMYGAYMGDTRPIASAAVVVMLFDTAIALVMALLIFSIVFAFGMQADSGPGLIFETLPVAFSQITENSMLWSTSFFTLLGIAALASAFSLLEPSIAWVVEQFKVSRRFAAWFVGGLAWLMGALTIYSFNQQQYSFFYFGKLHHNGVFDTLNIFTTHLLMPFTALLIAIFAGWRVKRRQSQAALAIPVEFGYRAWRFCIKLFSPIIIVAALVAVLFYPV